MDGSQGKQNRAHRGFRKSNRANTDSCSNASSRRTYHGFNPDAMILSQYSKKSNWIERLKWLQPRRDVGLWIQCSSRSCRKWRFVNEYHDPVNVPKKWYCNMNSDHTVASCEIEEIPVSIAIQEDLIENKYNAGSLVLARYEFDPWWPAMVDDSPETFTYYKLQGNSDIPIEYHVIFFDDDVLKYGWISAKLIKPFTDNIATAFAEQRGNYDQEYKNRLDQAYNAASSAIPFSIKERLKRFSLVARYTKLQNSPSETVTEDYSHAEYQTCRTFSDMTSNITTHANCDEMSFDGDEVPSSQYNLDLKIQQMTKSLRTNRGS